MTVKSNQNELVHYRSELCQAANRLRDELRELEMEISALTEDISVCRIVTALSKHQSPDLDAAPKVQAL